MQTINFFRPSFEKNRCSMKRLKLRFLILFFSGNLQRVSRCFFAARIPKCLLTMICFSLLFRMGVKKKNTQSLNKYLHFNRPSSFQSQSQYYLSKKKKKKRGIVHCSHIVYIVSHKYVSLICFKPFAIKERIILIKKFNYLLYCYEANI